MSKQMMRCRAWKKATEGGGGGQAMASVGTMGTVRCRCRNRGGVVGNKDSMCSEASQTLNLNVRHSTNAQLYAVHGRKEDGANTCAGSGGRPTDGKEREK